jgi:hypothetical protein
VESESISILVIDRYCSRTHCRPRGAHGAATVKLLLRTKRKRRFRGSHHFPSWAVVKAGYLSCFIRKLRLNGAPRHGHCAVCAQESRSAFDLQTSFRALRSSLEELSMRLYSDSSIDTLASWAGDAVGRKDDSHRTRFRFSCVTSGSQ